MWHHADTPSDGSQSAWKVDSTCTLALPARPVAHTQAANNRCLGSLGVHTLDCWWVELWIYFTEIHQERRRTLQEYSRQRARADVQPLFLPSLHSGYSRVVLMTSSAARVSESPSRSTTRSFVLSDLGSLQCDTSSNHCKVFFATPNFGWE